MQKIYTSIRSVGTACEWQKNVTKNYHFLQLCQEGQFGNCTLIWSTISNPSWALEARSKRLRKPRNLPAQTSSHNWILARGSYPSLVQNIIVTSLSAQPKVMLWLMGNWVSGSVSENKIIIWNDQLQQPFHHLSSCYTHAIVNNKRTINNFIYLYLQDQQRWYPYPLSRPFYPSSWSLWCAHSARRSLSSPCQWSQSVLRDIGLGLDFVVFCRWTLTLCLLCNSQWTLTCWLPSSLLFNLDISLLCFWSP